MQTRGVRVNAAAATTPLVLTLSSRLAPQTVGVLTATVALIYIIFQIYFDWSWPTDKVRQVLGQAAAAGPDPDQASSPHQAASPAQDESGLAKVSAYLWSLAHFPFHLALVLIMEGATQFVVWWKIVELIDYVSDQFMAAFGLAEDDTSTDIASSMVRHLNETVNFIWEHYPRDLLVSHFHREKLLETIGNFKDTHLRDFHDPAKLEGNHEFDVFTDSFRALKVTTLNSILKNFNIEEISDAGWQDHPETYEQHAFEDAAKRFDLVYIYVFCLAGAALILMALLHVLSRPRLAGLMPRLVMATVLVFGVGLMLLASMARYEAHTRFTTTPWIIPSICIVFFFALVFIHTSRWAPFWRRTGRTLPLTEPEEGVRDQPEEKGDARTSSQPVNT